MHVYMNNLGQYLRPVPTSAGQGSSFASSVASTADVTGGHVDRFKLGKRYKNALVSMTLDTVLGTGGRLSVVMGIQDAAGSTGPWADLVGAVYGTTQARATQVIGNSVTSVAGPTVAAAWGSFNIGGARRYIRPVFNFDLATGVSSSGQSAVTRDVQLILAGGEEIPVDSGLVPTSST